MPSCSPKPACVVHVVESEQSASRAIPQPCPRRAHKPLRAGKSAPIIWLVPTSVAPSAPALDDPKASENGAGDAVVPPALAIISVEGPRCGPRPELTAGASPAQQAATVSSK